MAGHWAHNEPVLAGSPRDGRNAAHGPQRRSRGAAALGGPGEQRGEDDLTDSGQGGEDHHVALPAGVGRSRSPRCRPGHRSGGRSPAWRRRVGGLRSGGVRRGFGCGRPHGLGGPGAPATPEKTASEPVTEVPVQRQETQIVAAAAAGAVREFARLPPGRASHAAGRRMFSRRPAVTAGRGRRFRGRVCVVTGGGVVGVAAASAPVLPASGTDSARPSAGVDPPSRPGKARAVRSVTRPGPALDEGHDRALGGQRVGRAATGGELSATILKTTFVFPSGLASEGTQREPASAKAAASAGVVAPVRLHAGRCA